MRIRRGHLFIEIMEYDKPHRSFEEQADLLISRGLINSSRKDIISKLEQVSYYRLSSYWYSFREDDAESLHKLSTFKADITFEKIWNHYIFDRQLKFLLLDAIERIEVFFRTRLLHFITQEKAAFGYLDSQIFTHREAHTKWLAKVQSCVERAKNSSPCIKHFYKKYGDSHENVPMWMVAEVMDYGCLNLLFQNIERSFHQDIIHNIGFSYEILVTWIKSLNNVRNSCAHHEYVWNRTWSRAPKTPRKCTEWHIFNKTQFKTGIILFVCRQLLKTIAPSSEWAQRIESLFARFQSKGIDFSEIGLPPQWQEHPLWKAH